MSSPALSDPVTAPAPVVRHREHVRDEAVAAIPAWYSPWGHLLATSTVGLGVVAFALSRLHRPRAIEFVTLAGAFVVSNAVEWFAHRYLLHHRIVPLHLLYDRHTPMHHAVYGYDDMALRSWREARLVLIPALGIAGIVALAAPIALAVGLLLGANIGWLALAEFAAYVVLYEWSHLSYHLPPSHPIGRWKLVAILREHHRRHHHPRLMQRWNFNVTVPLFDWLQRSRVDEKHLEEALSRDRHGSSA